MRNIVLFTFLILSVLPVCAQQSRLDYISTYQLLAIEEMIRSGIPASITIAQGCLESADGNSELSRKSNNHFGIKCKSSWKGKKVYYDDDRRNECFRKYTTVQESYIDHTDFLMNNPRYASLFKLKQDDYKGWARGLKKAGYATAKDYDKKLIKIIEDYKLHRLDLRISFEHLAVYGKTKFENEGMSNSLTINPFQTRRIEKINGVKSVVARKGDTYEVIAQETGKKTWELNRFNNVQKGYRPQKNEVVYIENKKRKASKSNLYHTVAPGETMHYISQKYGVKLRSLYLKNRMKFSDTATVGQTLSLRKKVKKN